MSDRSKTTRAHQPKFFSQSISVIRVVALLSFCVLAAIQSAAADLRPTVPEVDDVLATFGRGLASKADSKLKAEVGKYARENMILGITGDLIPSGEVTYVRGGACTQDGRVGGGMEFSVHARAKVDAGTRKLGVKVVRKVWAVDTVQIIQILAFPKQGDNGVIGVDLVADIVSASATPERQAKQREADAFRDRVGKELRSNLSNFNGEVDLQHLFQLLKQ